jgi:predicted membrane protein
MSHHHGHGGLGPLLLVAAIAFVFGKRTAQIIVGTVLVAGAAFFLGVLVFVLGGWA